MADDDKARIARLERELAASRKTVDALVRRVERQTELDPGRFAVLKAMAQLEEVITARERDLARSEAWFRVLWDRCPDMLLTVDAAGRVHDLNQAARAAGLQGSFVDAFEDRARAMELLGQHPIDEELRLADGRPVHLHGTQLDARLDLLVIRDLSVRRMLQDELNQARRLAVVGELAEAVAHEINNPLAVILGRLELLRAVEDPDPVELARSLDVVQDHARRIGLISRNLHVFGRPSLGHQRSSSVRRLIDRAVAHGGRRMADVRVSVEVAPPDLEVHGDPVQLEQVVAALLLHAADSMHRRGGIEVRAYANERYFTLDVTDQSGGVPQGLNERLERVWSPTEQPTRGLMLGMAVAAGIVRRHGGRLRAVQLDTGCTYRVTLPQDELRPDRGLKVLLVDPRPGRARLAEMLQGHQVRVAWDGPGALEALDAESPDVILAAPYLRGLQGPLSQVVRSRRPDLGERVVLLIGPDQPAPPTGRFLRSPFSALDLFEALDAVAG